MDLKTAKEVAALMQEPPSTEINLILSFNTCAEAALVLLNEVTRLEALLGEKPQPKG